MRICVWLVKWSFLNISVALEHHIKCQTIKCVVKSRLVTLENIFSRNYCHVGVKFIFLLWELHVLPGDF